MEPNQPQTPENQPKNAWDDNIRTVIFALLLALVFRSVLFEPFHIPSGSMKSNLLVGDYLFVSKYSYGYSRYSFPLGAPLFKGRVMETDKPHRGDVVVFRLPTNTRIDYIKRIMGLPGDKIQVKEGLVYINGSALPRKPLGDFVENINPGNYSSVPRFAEILPEGKVISILKEKENGPVDNTPVYTVPEGHYFMMGDNRDNSRDSRYLNEVGYVPEENLVGRAEFIFFSIDDSAELLNPLSWFAAIRANRLFKHVD